MLDQLLKKLDKKNGSTDQKLNAIVSESQMCLIISRLDHDLFRYNGQKRLKGNSDARISQS